MLFSIRKPNVNAFTKGFLQALLMHVHHEYEERDVQWLDIKTNWRTSNDLHQLVIATNMSDLAELIKITQFENIEPYSFNPESLVLRALEELNALGLLEDERPDPYDYESYNFAINLWSLAIEENLQRFDGEWLRFYKEKYARERPDLKYPLIFAHRCHALGLTLPLPAHHISRTQALSQLKDLILSNSNSDPIVIHAKSGMEGVGSSTIVRELLRDPVVLEPFPDGFRWLTFGKDPDLLALLHQCIWGLGDYQFKAISIGEASNRLKEMLRHKRLLFILDNVRDESHLEPFKVIGGTCAQLITSRNLRLENSLEYELKPFTADQASQVLQHSLGHAFAEDSQQTQDFIAEVESCPLVLEVGSSLIKKGWDWDELLQKYKAEETNIQQLFQRWKENDQAPQNLPLWAMVLVTIKSLSVEQQRCFAWLGVLSETVAISANLVATLLAVSPEQGEETLLVLKTHGLLSYRDESETYHFQSAVHDIALSLLTQEQDSIHPIGIQCTLPEAHQFLLDQYQLKTQNQEWSTLPEDGYIHQHLGWHMEKTQDATLLHALMQEKTLEERNAWFEACDRAGDPFIFVRDLSRAMSLAEVLYLVDPTWSIALQMRYALILASLRSIKSKFSKPFLLALYEDRILSPAQCFHRAIQETERTVSVPLIVSLAEIWSPSLLEQSLRFIREMDEEHPRFLALRDIIPVLPDRLLPSAILIATEFQESYNQVFSLATLTTRCPEIVPEVFELSLGLPSERSQVEAWNKLAEHLSLAQFDRTLERIKQFKDEETQSKAYSSLAKQLPEALWPKLLQDIGYIEDEFTRHYLSLQLCQYSPSTLSRHVIALTDSVSDEGYQAEFLCNLIPRYPKVQRLALTQVRSIKNAAKKVRAFQPLMWDQPALLPEVLQSLDAAAREDYQAAYLVRIVAPFLDESWSSQILNIIKKISDENERIQALSCCIPYCPDLVSDAFSEVQSMGEESSRSYVLAEIAEHLPPPLIEDAFAMAFAMEEESARVRALIGLLPKLNEDSLLKILTVEESRWPTEKQTELLINLAAYLPQQALSRVFEIACKKTVRKFENPLLKGIVKYLPEELIVQALHKLCDIDYSFKPLLYRKVNEDEKVEPLMTIAPYLSPQLLRKVLEEVCLFEDDYNKASFLKGIASCLQHISFAYSLRVVRSIQDNIIRSELVNEISPVCPKPFLAQLLRLNEGIGDDADITLSVVNLALESAEQLTNDEELLQEIEDESQRLSALKRLAPHLTESMILGELEHLKMIGPEEQKVSILGVLAPYLTEPAIEVAFQTVMEMNSPFFQRKAFLELVECLDINHLQIFMEAVQRMEDESKYSALYALAPYLTGDLIHQAVSLAQTFSEERFSKGVIIRLSSYLTESSVSKAFEIANVFQDSYCRLAALQSLAQYKPDIVPGLILEARNLEHETIRKELINKLRPLTRNEIPSETLEWIRQSTPQDRIQAFLQVVHSLPLHLFSEVLDTIQELKASDAGKEALRELIPHVPRHYFPRGLEMISQFDSDSVLSKVELVVLAAEYSPRPYIKDVLALLDDIPDDDIRTAALLKLNPFLPPKLMTQTKDIDPGFTYESETDQVRIPSASQATYRATEEIFERSFEINDETQRLEIHTELLPRLTQQSIFKLIDRYYLSLPSHSQLVFKALSLIEDKQSSAEQFSQIIRILSSQGRSALLEAVNDLTPVMVYISDKSIVPGLKQSIKEIRVQWA